MFYNNNNITPFAGSRFEGFTCMYSFNPYNSIVVTEVAISCPISWDMNQGSLTSESGLLTTKPFCLPQQ